MTLLDVPMKRVIAGTALVAALAFAGPLPASAQETTTSTASAGCDGALTSSSTSEPRTTATPEMIEEAVARSKARHQRFLSEGVPEQFGSEGCSFTLSSGTSTQ